MPHPLDDLLTGFALLTRLPLPDHVSRGAAAAWSWPVVGLVVGGLAALSGWLVVTAGLSAAPAAVLVLAVQVLLTGGLHEDGLADTADGLWGGRTKERRLEIMRDSRIGSYGVVALVLALLARWSVMVQVLAYGSWGALVAAAVLSRGVLPGVMALVGPARQDGLSRGVGRPSVAVAAAAAGLAVLIGVLVAGWGVLPAVVACGVVAVGMGRIAVARIGGQTGDILGAVQVLAEIGVLFVLVG
ncbi:adenosylcobinamide-GDP ribazoletransferase [Primorskyibacter flagellatus]|uniref:Adenosylcobinamide-GDP ribazoletransferase n=1 Tax=Primorskyibacter flagellatus TaxID=1387277 RepID=A0A917A4D2_9RHOB|nr:adenosylcobinamide-GDP ribazoletransferase [Primorskyibacter flagellatus]GGE26460.1 adenosylcobinamide-GDP ribazoletransferase [Primorskyibacter flagellatus]